MRRLKLLADSTKEYSKEELLTFWGNLSVLLLFNFIVTLHIYYVNIS